MTAIIGLIIDIIKFIVDWVIVKPITAILEIIIGTFVRAASVILGGVFGKLGDNIIGKIVSRKVLGKGLL